LLFGLAGSSDLRVCRQRVSKSVQLAKVFAALALPLVGYTGYDHPSTAKRCWLGSPPVENGL
jgi:hypothetical protein